jgi:hypothetical protein
MNQRQNLFVNDNQPSMKRLGHGMQPLSSAFQPLDGNGHGHCHFHNLTSRRLRWLLLPLFVLNLNPSDRIIHDGHVTVGNFHVLSR